MSMNVYSYGAEVLLRDDNPTSGGGAPPASGLLVWGYNVEVLLLDPGSTTYNESADNAMSLSETATTDVIRSVSSSLGLTDSATVETIRSVSNELSLDHSVSVGQDQSVSSNLDLEDLAEADLTHNVASEMTLTDEVDFEITRSVSNELDLLDEALADVTKYASSEMDLVDGANLVYALTLASDLSVAGVAFQNLAFTVNALSAMELAQDLSSNIFVLNLANEMSLVHSATLPTIYNETINDLLALTQDSRPNIQNLSTSSALGLTSDMIVRVNDAIQANTSSVLSLGSVASFVPLPIRRYLPVGLFDDSGNPIPGGVPNFDDVLHLDGVVTLAGDKRQNLASAMTLNHIVALSKIQNFAITQGIGVTDRVGRVFDPSVTSILSFNEVAERIFSEASVLALTQTLSAYVAKFARNDLALIQNLLLQIIRNRALTSGLELVQSLSYVIPNRISLCTYSPFRGLDSPVPAIAPTTSTGTLTLMFPPTSPSSTVVLRNPDFGNQNSLAFQRINRTSRGGTLLIYANPLWPKQQTQNYSIQGLSQAQVTALLDFALTSIGRPIGLIDHEGRSWQGLIVNPDMEVTQVGQGCNFSVSFQFEGTLQ